VKKDREKKTKTKTKQKRVRKEVGGKSVVVETMR
jgi:hypothetical protein